MGSHPVRTGRRPATVHARPATDGTSLTGRRHRGTPPPEAPRSDNGTGRNAAYATARPGIAGSAPGRPGAVRRAGP
ncbi:hypothetical protein ACFVTT_24735, partial [Streptomyces niveus]|uniref:hypothetical protein n=1 Tax=Streptomyces niveus TaxID=193462 RepID=UPI0036D7D55B